MINERILKALGTSALESDSKGGIYLHKSFVENLDKFLASVEHLQGSLEAKTKEVDSLNTLIEEMKKNHTEALTAKDAEMAAKIKEIMQAQTVKDEAKANDEENRKKEMEQMEKDHAEALAAKDAEIAQLKNELAQKDTVIAEKDSEIEELSLAAQNAPTPKTTPKNNATAVTRDEELKAVAIVKPGMSTKEKQEAMAARMEFLEKNRYR